MDDEKFNSVLQRLMARLEISGVAAIKVSDGEIFAFTRERLMEVIDQMDESKQDRAFIFVKTGPDSSKVVDN